MKRLCLISVFSLVFGIGYAQDIQEPRNMLRVGLNGIYFSSGDVIGIGISTEYVYNLKDFLAITPRIMIGTGENMYVVSNSFSEYHQIASYGTSLSARFTPFPNSFNRLKIDIGGLYQRFTKTWGQILPQDMDQIMHSTNPEYYSESLFGFLGSLNINILDTRRIETGLRLELFTSLNQGYLESDAVQTGIYFGLKF